MVWCVFKLDSDNTLSYVCYIPNKISLINWKSQFSGPGEISLFICHWSHRCFIQRVYYIFLARSIENQCDDNSILCKCFRFLLNTAISVFVAVFIHSFLLLSLSSHSSFLSLYFSSSYFSLTSLSSYLLTLSHLSSSLYLSSSSQYLLSLLYLLSSSLFFYTNVLFIKQTKQKNFALSFSTLDCPENVHCRHFSSNKTKIFVRADKLRVMPNIFPEYTTAM